MKAAEADQNHKTSPQLVNETQFVLSNKKFHLPVFNRYSSITLHLLVESFEGLNPIVTVSVLHKSAKLILEADKESENKKTTIWTLSIGLIIFAVGFFFLFKHYTSATAPLILSAIWSDIFANRFRIISIRSIHKTTSIITSFSASLAIA